MSDLMKINQTGEPRWFTNEEIATGFECAESSIRDCKSENKDYFIEGIDWIEGFVGTPTKHTQGGRPPTKWSEMGVLKLAEKMKLTAKAQLFLLQYRVQEAKREMMANVIPMIQELKNENLALKEQSQKALNYSAEAKMDSYDTKNEIHHNLGDIQKSINDLRDDFKWGESPLMTVGEFCKVYKVEYLTDDQKMEIGRWCAKFTRREGNEVAEEKIPGGHIKLYRLNILIWTVFKVLNLASYEQTIIDIYKFNRGN